MSLSRFDAEQIVSPSTGRPLDVLTIDNVRVRCIVGLYASEAFEPQPLEVSLTLHLDTSGAADDRSLAATVDYARLEGEVRFLLESCRFRMLETAAQALARYVLAPPTGDRPHQMVEAVDVVLRKPEALGGAGAGVPVLRIRRFAVDQRYTIEQRPFGEVDVIHESASCGIYRLRIAPGRAIPTHVHRRLEEAELVLGSKLLVQRRPVRAGTAFRWPHDLPHRYDNPAEVEQTVLCVDRPAFVPEDEIEVPDPPEGLSDVQGRSYYPREANQEDGS